MSEPIDDPLVRKPGWRERAHAAITSVRVRMFAGISIAGLLALLYLSQVAAVNTANGQLSTLSDQRTRLEREDARLRQQLGTVTSPAYIDARARAMGLAPAPASVNIIAVDLRHAGGQP